MSSTSLDRRTLLKASALGAGGLAVSAALPSNLMATAHAKVPPTPSFGSAIDAYARYEGQKQCIGSEQAGVAAFKTMVLKAYPGSRNLGVIRACGIGGSSEHKEGRAWDWGVYATRANEAAMAQEVINWLLATDRHGNRHALARRFGIMYMIWNRKIWKAYSNPGSWQTYTGSNPHTDHIHFSFSWAGARKQTSWWTGGSAQAAPVPAPARASWSGWTASVAGVASAPSAVSWSSTRTDLFVTGSNGRLLHRWMNAGESWAPGSTWEDLGAPPGRRLDTAPAAVSRGATLLDVFARADDGQLWRRSFSRQTGWTAWAAMGGYFTSAPSAASMHSGHLVVVAMGGNRSIYENSWHGSWRGWRMLTEPVTSPPAIVSWGNGRLDLFARGSRHDLVHKAYEGSWSGWTSLGGRLESTTIGAVSMAPGRLDVLAIGGGRQLYRRKFTGGRWSPAPSASYERFGGPSVGAISGVGATSMHSDHLEVFTRGMDGRLYHRWWA